jgi:hypothetical protein
MCRYSNTGAAVTFKKISASGFKRTPSGFTFSKFFCRMGRRPVYVDLDVGQGSIAVPGSVGKLLIYLPIQLGTKLLVSPF